MTFRQFAFNNVIRSKRTYLAHFLSSTFAIMIFFTYALLAFHPNLQGDLAASITINTFAKSGLQISQGLIFFFSFFFILYSVSAFLKTRKKDFGILMLHGMSRSQLNKLVFIENIIIGTTSILTGITIGMAFSKFILIMSNNLLMIDKGLPFYMPFKAIGITFGAFLLLFLFISLFTSRLINVEQLVELIKAEEKPKPEPKASLWLSLFALICIGLGYTAVFHSVNAIHYKDVKYVLFMMATGVSFVVLGTYFLFTQLSVYVLRVLKKRENIFFKKTNILTISDLVYQLKDNAKMFFMVTIISAVAFTAVGTCMGLGNSSMAESDSPFAFSYRSYNNNNLEKEHIKRIESELNDGGFNFKRVTYSIKQISDTIYNSNFLLSVIKISDYNKLAEAFGFEKESLKDENDSFVIPSRKVTNTKSNQNNFQLLHGNIKKAMHVNKILTPKELQDTNITTIIIPDSVYNQMIVDPDNQYGQFTINGFVVKDWEKTKKVAEKILASLQKGNKDINDSRVYNESYQFSALIFIWIAMKQSFGVASIMSVLIGIVFFTFAASFLYFRLYTDLERNQQQYKMIAKVGLSKPELKKIVTRQLALLFFLPIVIAITHSAVAFMALQKLANFSVLGSSVIVLVCFLVLQIIYFYFVRSQYLKKMYKTIF
ncbi:MULTISPECIES: FtsX-like permease family protein [Bacillus]|uniref:FtsX-like permease family protein n=1 Tax=Bacillus TaxID=1386 RepID=UPI0009D80519|nr:MULTISPECIES: FtsX-like permease family protein [Bacillus]PEB95591.1 ABC transporter permease [Bacillus cereus]PEC26665.1 ABC transporter permease [Bacillus thuringiensis]PEQ77105.1 ABC transporter permease [Bacillus cereus]PFZ17097.1 ABC transporter permease [Bacillus thuringiensis]SMD37437.1 putative ABC transport system permease protein [Bacillus sp. JKS001846]